MQALKDVPLQGLTQEQALYLAYCEAAFDTGNTDVVQFTLRKPLP